MAILVDNLFMVNRTRPHYHMSHSELSQTYISQKVAVRPTHLAPSTNFKRLKLTPSGAGEAPQLTHLAH